MIRRPPRSTQSRSSAASDVYKRQAYTPAHYVKKFLPKFTPQADLDKQSKDAGFDNWKSLLKAKIDWSLNPELPVVTPWKTTSPMNTPTWALERNPYYWEVDTDGNQLPYIDKIVMTLAENLEVVNLRACLLYTSPSP